MTTQEQSTGGIAILGGSFNPLHVGHLRLALEIHEALGFLVERVDLVPAAHPPHKEERHILPFDVRVQLAREAAAPYPWLNAADIEGERDLPSYTWDTLGVYAERWPGRERFFVLGIEDYAMLPSWRNGLRLPERCTLLVVPRGVYRQGDFERATRAMWPDARPGLPVAADGLAMQLGDARVLFQPVPWLPISASLIRERWLCGRSIDYLVPQGVAALLESRRGEIAGFWQTS